MLRFLLRALRRTLFVLVLLATALGVLDVATYDAAAWQGDYLLLKRELAQRYANLDWVVQHRKLDLAALDRETEDALLGAHSRVRAAIALRRFVRAFHDPHLRLVWGHHDAPAASPGHSEEHRQDPPLATLADAGYETEDRAFRFPFERLPGWKALDTGPFPTGIANEVAVLRIASFGEDRYLDVAEGVFTPGIGRRALQLAVRERLQQHLRDAIANLKKHGAPRLVVDVTGNGGGTEWVDEVVPLFTDRELVRRPARLIATDVDRSGVFEGRSVPSVLAPESEPKHLRGTGEWTGPLFVLFDRHTGSASEDFVVWLLENGVAKGIGERTAGAGGGYVDGGGWIRLNAAPFDVRAPNCARFLADGTNEIEGIAPHVELGFEGPDETAVAAALRRAVGL